MHVMFVCTGNVCRSPMAEAYFRHICKCAGRDDVTVSSSGTYASNGMEASVPAVEVMRQYGVDLTGHRSSSLTEERIAEADLIVAMTRSHRLHVGHISASAVKKTHLLMEFADLEEADVADPFGGTVRVYSGCFEEMKPALENLLLRLDGVIDADTAQE